ncbi:MAG: YqeG family HAD IIIA-type phosphatase [Trueperaceae bacterium]|nr:MAG: YqeG family HAD IIIA-type phosphatase [Trueperaceae bacterium]
MLLRPRLTVDAAYKVNPALLEEHHIRAVLVDLDDTVLASSEDDMKPVFRNWFLELEAADIPAFILSNGSRERVRKWTTILGIDGFSLAGKPFFPAYRRALWRLGSTPDETAMIGDQLFTDILGANLVGVMSIRVQPLSPGKHLHTRLIRKVENLILRGGRSARSLDR